ncbi:uncharacterized protein LOC131664273 [Phymastichus coffea]|uniref:uncharacterized protein LOC131664273 n=1 Tax=Phymastichus coffea TaxID=108790 RepID=UPI00273CC271|nr:uncharacterized protein LOC131664273 [Phymastichus coffea]
MSLFIVFLCISAVALASLEPSGYRPPGSSSSSQYLPPHHQLQHDHHQQNQHHQQKQPAVASLPPSSQYLPPSDVSAKPTSQYLTPQHQQPLQPAAPSGNYLPVTEKPHVSRPLPPANGYLPPPVPSSRPPPPPPPPAHDYLPPLSRSQATGPSVKAPVSDYLPSKRPVATASLPSNEYLPPHATNRQAASASLKTAPATPPKAEYLPARPNVPSTPKNDYLPPSQHSTPPSARVSVVTVSPYKLDGSAYTKQEPQQQQQHHHHHHQQSPKFGGSELVTAATSLPARSGGYSSGAEGYQNNVYQQSADHYLPPAAGASDFRGAADQSGYQYGAAGSAAGFGLARSEQPAEPAKYDFEYRVSDEFGNDFGHKETREGTQTHGSYSVLLPDGRKQIVQYEANENGFQPRISYEDVATVLGPKAALAGYDGNANNLGY